MVIYATFCFETLLLGTGRDSLYATGLWPRDYGYQFIWGDATTFGLSERKYRFVFYSL